jgi:hypothetical protein
MTRVVGPAMTQWRWSSGPIPPSGVASPCVQPRRGDRRGSGTRRRRGDSGTATDTSRRLTFMYLTRNGNTRGPLRAWPWSEDISRRLSCFYRNDVRAASVTRGARASLRSALGSPLRVSPLEIPADQRPRERRRTGLEPMIWRADHASGWQVPAKRNRADRVEPVQSGKNHENSWKRRRFHGRERFNYSKFMII